MNKISSVLWWFCILTVPLDLGGMFFNMMLHNASLMAYFAFLAVAKALLCGLALRVK